MSTQIQRPAAPLVAGTHSIAVVGISRRRSFGGAACLELKKRGYTVYPVHPSMDNFNGDCCYRSLDELPQRPDCLYVAVSPGKLDGLVEGATAAGIRRIWFQQGADFSEAARKAREAGIEVVTDRCILMYAEPVAGIHRFHQRLARLFGRY